MSNPISEWSNVLPNPKYKKLIGYLNMVAKKYGLEIDWETSNLDERVLNFVGDISDKDLSKLFDVLECFEKTGKVIR